MSLIPFILDLADELHEFSRCLANGIDINDFGFGLYTGTDQHQQPQQHQQQQQQQQQQQHQPQTSPRRSRTSSFSSFWMPSKRHHPYNRIKTACCAKSGEETVAGTPENSGKEASGSSSVVGAGAGGTPGKSASYSVVNKNGFQVSMNVKQFAPNELSVKTIDNCIVVEGRHDDKEDGHGVISRHFVRKYMLPKGYDPNDVLSTLSSDGILTVKAPPPPPPTAKNDEPNERIIEIQPTPGPTPVLVVSAKDITVKETSKKLPTTPSARLECQLPEKRQKLDLPPETEPEESVASSAPIPTTNTVNETDAASVVVAGTEEVVNDDVEMEKADEQINEIVLKQTEQQSDVEEIEKNDVEKKAENIEQAEKHIAAKKQEEQAEIVDETEKKLLDECMSDSNGDAKNVCEKMEESTSITDATKAATEKTNESAAATKLEESSNEKSNVAKMEVDEEVDKDVGQRKDNVAKKTDNTEIFVAILKTCSVKTAVKPAATAVGAADSAKQKKETETTNNTDTSSSSSTTTTTTTNTTNNNNNTSTNSNNTNTTTNNNLTSTDVATENSAKDVKDGNGVVTGEISDDIPKSANTDSDSAAATATAKISTDNSSKAESVADGDVEMETAVLSTDTTTTTTNIIDNVALLKAATADPADITDNNAEQNDILTESMDGITTTADSNTNTTATTVDNVECSLFAKKSHLGNGNNTTATPLVATEEMAN